MRSDRNYILLSLSRKKVKTMDQIDNEEDIASEEITNVDARPIQSDRDPDNLDLVILVLDDQKSDGSEKYRYILK